MMELVDMLGLGSSSVWSRGSSPLFGIMVTTNQLCKKHKVRIKKRKLNADMAKTFKEKGGQLYHEI